jgi:putative addiction module component (TIGR02574 family)
MASSKEILKGALNLTPAQKAELIDKLLSSLDKPDRELDELWAKEADDRLEAYDKGKLRAVSISEIIEKYR